MNEVVVNAYIALIAILVVLWVMTGLVACVTGDSSVICVTRRIMIVLGSVITLMICVPILIACSLVIWKLVP